jgi:hypothetical protein
MVRKYDRNEEQPEIQSRALPGDGTDGRSVYIRHDGGKK